MAASMVVLCPVSRIGRAQYRTAAAVSAFAIGVALVLVLGIARFMGLEEFTGF